ncbi:MAG: hypothetical protein KDA61_12595, partial [Planctomycetales bacterium]|nr:hypothetical protein [Planctomycetales bacterium]
GRGGGGGGGRRGGGGRGGAFNIAPEKVARVEVDLLCLDHGLREPSSGKPYEIRPIENYISDPAVIELVTAYGNGELPTAAAQAAAWHLNSGVSFEELAAKLTGTERQVVREPYFSRDQIFAAVEIAQRARELGASRVVKPRPFKLPSERELDEATSPGDEQASPGDVLESEEVNAEPTEAESAPAEQPAVEAEASATGSTPAPTTNVG